MNYIVKNIAGGELSQENNTSTPLVAGAEFIGDKELNEYSDMMVVCATDQNGVLKVQFSSDGINWDSSLSFPYSVGSINPPHVLTKAARYVRVRFENTSTSNQTYLRLFTYYGQFQKLTSALNSIVPQTFGATITRPIDFNLMVAKGLYQGHENTLKDGLNFDIDSTSTPEDITNEGGLYAGFPTGTPEAGQIVVAGADTGTVFYAYLASPDDLDYSFGFVSVAGAGTYQTGHNIYRCNFAYFVSSSRTATNVGDITIQNTPTTANVFCVIPTGYGQTFCSAYTVPSGTDAYLDRVTGSVRGSTSGTLNGAFYYRESTGGYRFRFPFELQFGSLYFDDVDYLIRIPAGTDIVPRILDASTNNLSAKISYRIVKVKR